MLQVVANVQGSWFSLFMYMDYCTSLHVMQSHRISLSGCMRSYSN